MRRVLTKLLPGQTAYTRLLIEAQAQPEKLTMPTCHEHIEALAGSIHRQELTGAVIVLVEPGIREPDIFGCFLCHKDG